MTMHAMETRLKALESDVAYLKEQLERSQATAGIERGLQAAVAGRMKPAREVLESLRKKYKIVAK